MGRNRKGRQCGGFGSKKERFVLQKRWQQEVNKVSAQSKQARHAQRRISEQQRREEANRNAVRRRVRVDVITAWTNARLKDDHIERIKREGARSIASELQRSSALEHFSSLQERCIFEIARTFDLYDASCPFTQAFFASFEPWMVSRLAELTTAFKTVSDGNVRLLLLQSTQELTLGFVRDEKSLAPLFEDTEGDHMAWQPTSSRLVEQEAESWEELDVDDVDLVQTQEDVQLLSLSLVSCLGLSSRFLGHLTTTHPFLEHLKVVDCFDAAAGEQGAVLLQQLARSRALKTLHFSWCCWLTTEILVTFAYQLLEPPASPLQELHISDCFDVLVDYVQSVFRELLPHVRVTC